MYWTYCIPCRTLDCCRQPITQQKRFMASFSSVCTQNTFWAYNTFYTISTDGSASDRVHVCVHGVRIRASNFKIPCLCEIQAHSMYTKRNLDGAYSTPTMKRSRSQKKHLPISDFKKRHLLMCADCGRIRCVQSNEGMNERTSERMHSIVYYMKIDIDRLIVW